MLEALLCAVAMLVRTSHVATPHIMSVESFIIISVSLNDI